MKHAVQSSPYNLKLPMGWVERSGGVNDMERRFAGGLACLVFLLTVLVAPSPIAAQDFTDSRRPEEWHVRKVTSATARGGTAPVGIGTLQGVSRAPITAIVGGVAGDNIVSVDLDVVVVTPPGSSAEAKAKAFLRAHLATLAPSVPFSELRQKATPYDCQTAPSFQSKSMGGTFIFERVVGGTAVVGGSISVRVEGDGRVVNVYNSLAPVSSRLVRPTELAGRFGLVKALSKSRRKRFDQLVPKAKLRLSILKKASPVLVPVRQGSSGGLLKARHATWGLANGEVMSAFLLADGTVLASTVIPGTRRGKTVPIAHIDAKTKLPTFLSYRSRGGLAVSAVGVFGNPAEIAFRYLEENPEVFRYGASRCGFEVLDSMASPVTPRVTFVKLGQVIAGRRVFGAELVFEIENGNRIQSIQGHTLGHVRMPLVPTVGPDAAKAVAAAQLATSLQGVSAADRTEAARRPISTDLVIFPGELVAVKGLPKPPESRLAYHTRSLMHGLFVDAVTGTVLYGYSRLPAANIVREAAGATILQKPIFVEVSRDGVTTSPGTALSPDAATAVTALGAVDTFYRAHGWVGRDGRGGEDMVVNVNVNLFTCPNAFSPPIDEETYFCTGDAVPDVVGHELTHSVVWNSSDLLYADESGALNESYADIMGNLAFRDVAAPGAVPGWLVGEGSAAAAAGIIRNMAAPGLSTPRPQPATYAGYLSRSDLGCSPFDLPGLTCDFGGVHTNSGITSLAHVVMSDGGVGGLAGMGRDRLRMIAFDVLTRRLSRLSRLIDSALATRASCDALLAAAARDLTGAPFRQLDCDQIPGAFASVGLEPGLVSNWLPPSAGFTGTIARFAADVTTNGCTITDLILQMMTPAGQIESQASVVGPGAALTVSYFGLQTATIATRAPPIGTVTMAHTITWTNVFGQTPTLSSVIVAPPPAGAGNCAPGNVIRETRKSAIATSPGIPLIGGAGTLVTGNAASNMNPACILVRADVELVDGAGNTLAGPEAAPTWSEVVWIAFVPVTLTRTATVTAQPVGALAGGPPNFNLSAPVAWSYSIGVANTRWRLVYVIDKPAGTTCTP
ncbi:MAG: M4 family metallopeptidase [Acidobacteriota bacterium]